MRAGRRGRRGGGGRLAAGDPGLPRTASVGFATGAQMANFTALAAARHAVLARARVGRRGARAAAARRRSTWWSARRRTSRRSPLCGCWASAREPVKSGRRRRAGADGRGALREALTGLRRADDRLRAGGQREHRRVRSASTRSPRGPRAAGCLAPRRRRFGSGRAACPALRELPARRRAGRLLGGGRAQVAERPLRLRARDRQRPRAHRCRDELAAAYLVAGRRRATDSTYVPEFSRRARGFTVWAALRSLGRAGVAALIERCCATGAAVWRTSFPRRIGVRMLNEVALNQVLFAIDGDDGTLTAETIARVQEDGTCWLAGTRWRDTPAIRVSISNWSTTERDVTRSAEVIRTLFPRHGTRSARPPERRRPGAS